ncbi:MAG: hypothetical protein IPF53_01350 [Blastocatellia bacterium]|nr:hypothetical protein [Blastocatellia bacterium]MBK6425296.1 hypothetical protein [Blastocatellia bacterium]
MSPELLKLIQLQDIDVRVFELTDRLDAIPAERRQIEDQFRQQAAEYLGLEESLASAREHRVRIDEDLANYEQTHEKFKADLMRVQNTKEYATVIREIDATKKAISALETEALQLMERIEATEKEITDRAPEFDERRAEVDALMAGFDKEVKVVDSELEELRGRRKVIAAEVSGNMLRVYDRIAQTRKGRAMSEARGEIGGKGRCSACNMALRPQVFSDIRRGDDLIVCDNCNRILFYRPEQDAPAEASAS